MAETDEPSSEQLKALERTYAHFHRVLGELLQELAELPGTVWLQEPGHEVRGEGEENTYRKAVYPVGDLSPYRARLEELEAVQQEGLALLAREAPTRGLLPPTVAEGVHYARLRKHATSWSRAVRREYALGRLKEQLVATRTNLKAFEVYATTYDPKREAVEHEVRALEAGIERLEACREELLRERLVGERVKPYVYLRSGEVVRPHIRDAGLILVGPHVKVSWSHELRRQRSDKRQLEPLVRVGRLELYSERDWQGVKG